LRDTIAQKEVVNKQLEQFSHIVAHDLKSPLTGIISLVELLKEDERINHFDGIQECLELLSDAAGRSSDMINALLQSAKQSSSLSQLEQTDTAEMVRQLIRLLFVTKPTETIIEPALPVFKTNKVKLTHIFHNLISNAIKHNDKPVLQLHIGTQDTGEWYEFFVKDNGSGIEEADNKRIFNLFETAGSSNAIESSTGVGLNIVKMYVEEQGGRIWVDSQPGVGSTFFFRWRKEVTTLN
jgi:two-component system, sensor histidine kinase and response regulator